MAQKVRKRKWYTAHVNHKGVKHYVGCFPTKHARAEAMRVFRESQPLEVCPCGNEFIRPLQAQREIQFCQEHRRWANQMRYRFGIEDDLLAALIILKSDGCAICGSVDKMLHVDHDHATHDIRGWLCITCNVGLGSFQDNPDLLRGALVYLVEGKVTS